MKSAPRFSSHFSLGFFPVPDTLPMAEELDYESLPSNAGLTVSISSFLRKEFLLNLLDW